MAMPDLQICEPFDEELSAGFVFLNCFYKLKKIAEAAKINDFSLKDFYAPNSKRLVKLFSGLMNFAFYEQERLTLFNQLNDRRAESVVRNQELKEILEQLQCEIKGKQEILHEQTLKRENLKSTQDALIDQIATLEESQNAYQAEIKKFIQKEEEAKQRKQQIENAIVAANDEIDRLNIQLSFDPNQIQEIIQKASDELDCVQLEATEVEKKFKQSSEKLKFMDKNREKLIEALEKCHPILFDVKKQREVQAEAESLAEQRNELEEMRRRVQILRQRKAQIDQDKKKQDAAEKEVNQKIKAQKAEQRKLLQQKKNSGFDAEDQISMMRARISDYFDALSRSMNDISSVEF
ncbi:hypothetical protein TRFO_35828 [Tritrichomonas foetus]|uniref:Kinetochore protein Nuf2 N-terminal domain-containing protein n=1 Tax=Tritrichomonas foetus TaxID=1144522 RepID=A0A1J4JK38_9EUKA|nr:hypothetical protein TRFO_35828 [Tritrichomonas foetus]|eukprot:OHS97891.1 hypothetical protein TRFO_35828 [Tritrichomonas foetus]